MRVFDIKKGCGAGQNCSDLGKVNKVGAAFQIASGACYLLGTANTTVNQWSLLDNERPAKGVVLTYTDGTYCASEKRNRQFIIQFECPDTTRESFEPSQELTINTTVTEQDTHACKLFFCVCVFLYQKCNTKKNKKKI